MEMGGEDGIYFGDEWTGLFPMRSVWKSVHQRWPWVPVGATDW
jgi:hypothetical protein